MFGEENPKKSAHFGLWTAVTFDSEEISRRNFCKMHPKIRALKFCTQILVVTPKTGEKTVCSKKTEKVPQTGGKWKTRIDSNFWFRRSVTLKFKSEPFLGVPELPFEWRSFFFLLKILWVVRATHPFRKKVSKANNSAGKRYEDPSFSWLIQKFV